MFYLFLSYFIIFSFFALNFKRKINNSIIYILPLLFIIFIRPINWGADIGTYIELFNQVSTGIKVNQEVTFILISRIAILLGNSVKILFILYGICSLGLKIESIKNYSYYPYVSFLLYFSCWFILHDLYQIRVGAAIAFFYLSIPYLQEKKYGKYLLFSCIATSFHTQAAVLFLLVFIPKKKISIYSILFYFVLLLSSYFVYFCQIDLFKNIISFLEKLHIPRMEQIGYYYKIATSGIIDLGKINAFSPIVLVRLFLSIILLCQYKRLNTIPYYSILIRILIISFAIRMIAYPIPVLGMRVYEFFTCIDIFIFPLFFKLIKEKKIVYLLTIFYCIFMLLITLKGTL